MAEVVASEVLYGIPVKTVVGDLFLTATKLEFPATKTTPATGGLELNLEKLGLTVGAVLGAGSAAAAQGGLSGGVGATASTTSVVIAAWTSGLAITASQAAKGEAITSAVPVALTVKEGKIFLRFFAVPTLKKDWLEITTAETANGVIANTEVTVFVLGK